MRISRVTNDGMMTIHMTSCTHTSIDIYSVKRVYSFIHAIARNAILASVDHSNEEKAAGEGGKREATLVITFDDLMVTAMVLSFRLMFTWKNRNIRIASD